MEMLTDVRGQIGREYLMSVFLDGGCPGFGGLREVSKAFLGVGDWRGTPDHCFGNVKNRIPIPCLVLEPLSECPAPDIFQNRPEVCRHSPPVHLKSAHEASKHGCRPVILGGAQEATFPEGSKDH